MSNLSPQAQHVIDSLEAHFAAVRAAAEGGGEELVSSVENFASGALEALGEFVASLRGGSVGAVTKAPEGEGAASGSGVAGGDAA